MGLEPAILAGVQQLLSRPTGGVPWNEYAPLYAEAVKRNATISTTETTALEVQAEGYLHGLRYFVRTDGREVSATIRVYRDGTAFLEHDMSIETVYVTDGQAISGVVDIALPFLIAFNTSIKITLQANATDFTADVSVAITGVKK